MAKSRKRAEPRGGNRESREARQAELRSYHSPQATKGRIPKSRATQDLAGTPKAGRATGERATNTERSGVLYIAYGAWRSNPPLNRKTGVGPAAIRDLSGRAWTQ
jgi:hypothetical protein